MKTDLDIYQHPEDSREFTCKNMTWGNQDALCFMEELLVTERTEVCWFHSDDLRAALFRLFPCFNTRLAQPSKKRERKTGLTEWDERFWELMTKQMSHKCGWIGHLGVYKSEQPDLCCTSSKTNIPAVMDCKNSPVTLLKDMSVNTFLCMWIIKKHFILPSVFVNIKSLWFC